MPPRNSTPSSSEPKPEILEVVLNAIRSLAKVVEKHVSTSGIAKPKDAEIEGCMIEQFKKMGLPSFLGNPDPIEAETWIMQMEKIFDVVVCIEVQKVIFALSIYIYIYKLKCNIYFCYAPIEPHQWPYHLLIFNYFSLIF